MQNLTFNIMEMSSLTILWFLTDLSTKTFRQKYIFIIKIKEKKPGSDPDPT